MPFLDWVNQTQAQRVAADAPHRLLQFQPAHGDVCTDKLPALKALLSGEQGGGVRCHTLGEPVFDADGGIQPSVRFAPLATYL